MARLHPGIRGRMVIDSLALVGITEADIPPGAGF
jgi:hypothetical protein